VHRGVLAAALAAALAGCGKPEAPKVDAAALRAHEQAKALAADANKKAEASMEAADKMSK
jgi:ABC-type uncharacterized transport system auxiliary subunit